MPDYKTYNEIVVSAVEFDFNTHAPEAAPPQFYEDWIVLVAAIAKVVHPAFEAPRFPATLEWIDDRLPSDGPYPASEDYYLYDVGYFQIKGENGYGFEVLAESGRQDREPCLNVETLGFPYSVTSSIPLNSPSGLATFLLFAEPDQIPIIEQIFALHRERCLSKRAPKPS